MSSQGEIECARAYLLKLLAHRPRSRREVLKRLQQKGFSQSTIEATIQHAQQKGWINDALFARLWIEDRLMHKPKGRRALERELLAKGLEAEPIQQALARIEIKEETLAEGIARERISRYRDLDPKTRARRLAAFLRRRGFALNVIYRVLERLA